MFSLIEYANRRKIPERYEPLVETLANPLYDITRECFALPAFVRPDIRYTYEKEVYAAQSDTTHNDIEVNTRSLDDMMRLLRGRGLRISEREYLIFALSEEFSHLAHYQRQPSTFIDSERVVKMIVINSLENEPSKVLDEYKKNFILYSFQEAVAKYGQRYAERKLGTFDERTHAVYIESMLPNCKKQWEIWKTFFNTHTAEQIKKEADILVVGLQNIHFTSSTLVGERFANAIETAGHEMFLKLLASEHRDIPFDELGRLYDLALREIYPDFDRYAMHFATAHLEFVKPYKAEYEAGRQKATH